MGTSRLDSKWEFFHLIGTKVLFRQSLHKVRVICLHERDVRVLEDGAELNGLEDICEVSDNFWFILSVEK
jgi:hypothetical protein